MPGISKLFFSTQVVLVPGAEDPNFDEALLKQLVKLLLAVTAPIASIPTPPPIKAVPVRIALCFLSRATIWISSLGISKGLFSYQIFIRARAMPTVPALLSETIERSDEMKKAAATAAAM